MKSNFRGKKNGLTREIYVPTPTYICNVKIARENNNRRKKANTRRNVIYVFFSLQTLHNDNNEFFIVQ